MREPEPPTPVAGKRDEARIAALRARYESLREDGQSPEGFATGIAAAPRMPRRIRSSLLRSEDSVAAGGSWFGALPRGSCLRLDNPDGAPGIACLMWSAADPGERFSVADTVKVQWTAALGRGRLLLSDMGRVLASIVEDTCGRHDPLLGAGQPRQAEDASPMERRNGAENLLLGAAKLGLAPRDVHAPITFFAAVRCENGRFRWDHNFSPVRTYVDLYAEMDLLIALSNTPHPLSPPGLGSQPVQVQIWRPAAGASTFCRNANREAERAFARTDAYHAARQGSGHAGHR